MSGRVDASAQSLDKRRVVSALSSAETAPSLTLPEVDWLPAAICIAREASAIDSSLHDAEAALVANAVQRRREHFAAGRACAHEALRRIGRPVEALLRRASGSPAWPSGHVGSITHCAGMAAAVVAASTHWRAIGIDVEPDQPLLDEVSSYALTPAERERLAAMPGGVAGLGLLAFSAKECVHKCVHPLRGAFLEFDEVEIDFTVNGFAPRPISTAAKAAFAGLHWESRWLRADGFAWALLAAS